LCCAPFLCLANNTRNWPRSGAVVWARIQMHASAAVTLCLAQFLVRVALAAAMVAVLVAGQVLAAAEMLVAVVQEEIGNEIF